MLQYSLITLCLLLGHEVLSDKQQSRSSHYLIAPAKSSDDNFAVMQYEELTRQAPRKLHIELRIYDQKTDEYTECSFNLTARWNSGKTGVSTLKRLSHDKVVFAWYDELADGLDRRTRIVAMNDDCRQIHPVLENLPGKPLVLPSFGQEFDVIVDDEVTCRSVGSRCRISYHLGTSNVGRVWPLNVNLDWSTMHVDSLRNGDFLFRGYEGTTYKVLRVDHLSGANETLISQFEANPQPEFVTSELSICGIVYPGSDKFTQCLQYDNSNELTFQQRVWFNEPMTLIDVHGLGDGKMFLLVGKTQCSDEFDCWKLYGTMLDREQVGMKPSFSHFHCTGDRRGLRVFDVSKTGDRVAVRYACKEDEDYSYNVNYFDVSGDDFY